METRSQSPVTPERLASLADYSGAPWTPDNHYFVRAEPYMAALWDGLVWPFIADCDFTHVLDLAAGHGRNTAFLLKFASHVTVMDIQEGNVAACERRFADQKSLSYLKNNGFDFHPVEDNSVTLIYCFDAMVHFDSDVIRSYLCDARRILKPGGRAFLHHSNYTGGHDWRQNPAARNFMSRALFEHYAVKESLGIVRQQIINWGADVEIDCLSLIEKPG